jgi:hypothetical protein
MLFENYASKRPISLALPSGGAEVLPRQMEEQHYKGAINDSMGLTRPIAPIVQDERFLRARGPSPVEPLRLAAT